MSKQILKPVSPKTSVWVDEEDKKQSSIDFLIEQIEIILKLNNIQLNAGYKINTILPIIEKLKSMHKEEIEKAYSRGREEWSAYEIENQQSDDVECPTPRKYFNKTFGGDNGNT